LSVVAGASTICIASMGLAATTIWTSFASGAPYVGARLHEHADQQRGAHRRHQAADYE
jgi:hypothetical protein